MSLRKYLEQKNAMARIFKQPVYEINYLTAKDAEEIFRGLDGALSPENLSCDGELPRAKVQARYKLYMSAIADLEKMGFKRPQMYSI